MRARVTATMTMMALCAAGAASVQAGVYLSGVLHEPLGSATFDPAVERRLPIHNLGSSGEDGVEVQLRSAWGGGVAVDVSPLAVAADGEIKIRHKGWDGTIKGTVRLTSTGNGDGSFNLTADLSPMGATSIQYQDFDSSGTLVDQGTLGTGGIQMIPDCPPPKVMYTYYTLAWNELLQIWQIQVHYVCIAPVPPIDWPHSTERTIQLTPIVPAGVPTLEGIESLRVTGKNFPEMTVADAELETFGVSSWGLGQAHVSEECDNGEPCGRDERRLPVRNLGSSGEDGVAVDLGSGASWASLRSKRCPDCPPGHVTLIKVYDDAARQISQASSSENPATGSEQLAVDFSPIGAAGCVVDCLDGDGQLLASVAVAGVAVIDWSTICPPGSYPTFTWWKGGWIFTGCVYYMDFTLPGGTVVPNVHSVSFRPLSPLLSYGPPRRFEMTDTGPGSEMAIDDVQVGRCEGDVDRDGDVDQDDLDVILFNFGTFPAVGQNGDIDGDGDVDQDDLDLVLFYFGCV